MEKLAININANDKEILYLRSYFLDKYDDIRVQTLDYRGQELNETLIVCLLFISVIGGGAGIKAIYDIISSIRSSHKKTVRITEDGEFIIENLSVKEFIQLYENIERTNESTKGKK